MLRVPGNRTGVVEFAARIYELKWIQKLATGITLVTSGVFVSALGANTLYKTICQESLVFLAEKLGHGLLDQEIAVVEICEDILGDLGLAIGGGTAEVVEADIKPLVNVGMQFVVLITQFPGSTTLFQSFSFSRRSIFISSTDIKGVVIAGLGVSVFNVSVTPEILRLNQYLEKASALRTLPTIFPRCGTLFTYGSAEVMSMFLSPGTGSLPPIVL